MCVRVCVQVIKSILLAVIVTILHEEVNKFYVISVQFFTILLINSSSEHPANCVQLFPLKTQRLATNLVASVTSTRAKYIVIHG